MKKSLVFLLALLVMTGATQSARGESFAKVRQNQASEGEALCYWEVQAFEVYLGPGAAPEGALSLRDLNLWLQGNPAWEPFSASRRLTEAAGPLLDVLLRRRNCR